MPAVAAERGLLNPFDPLAAMPHSARFLKEHLRYFGNLGLAAAAYNGGARRVTDWLARRGRAAAGDPAIRQDHHRARSRSGGPRKPEIDLPVHFRNRALARVSPTCRARPSRPRSRCCSRRRLRRSSKPRASRRPRAAEAKAKGSRLAQIQARAAGLPSAGRRARPRSWPETAASKPGKLPPKIADRVTDKPKGAVRVAPRPLPDADGLPAVAYSRWLRRKEPCGIMRMNFDTIIRGGTIATASDTFTCDIGITSGRIAALGDDLGDAKRDRRCQRHAGAAGRHRQPCPYRTAVRPRHRHGGRFRLGDALGRVRRQHHGAALRHAAEGPVAARGGEANITRRPTANATSTSRSTSSSPMRPIACSARSCRRSCMTATPRSRCS